MCPLPPAVAHSKWHHNHAISVLLRGLRAKGGITQEGGHTCGSTQRRESAPRQLSTGAPTEGAGVRATNSVLRALSSERATEFATLRQARAGTWPVAWAPPTQYWSTN